MLPPPLPVLNGVDGTEPLDDLRELFAAGDAVLRGFFGWRSRVRRLRPRVGGVL